MGFLLSAVGLIRLARGVRARRWPVLAGSALTIVGIVLNSPQEGLFFLVPGVLILWYAVVMRVPPSDDRAGRSKLELELATYFTPAERRDLEATLDRYPDEVTSELRQILAELAMADRPHGIPGSRQS